MNTGKTLITLTAAGWIALGGLAFAQTKPTTPSEQEAPRRMDPNDQQAPRNKTDDTKKSDMSQAGTQTRTSMSTSSRDGEVKSLQEALKNGGYDPGAIDGRMGPHTKAALRKYQKAENLQVTGMLDEQTRTKLNLSK